MANISLTIPDAVLPRIIAAASKKFNYPENKLPSETEAQFAKRMLAQTLKGWVMDAEGDAPDIAAQAAKNALIADINNNVNIT